MENTEINNLMKTIGLHYNLKYENEEDFQSLRYGKIMIMADQVCFITKLYTVKYFKAP